MKVKLYRIYVSAFLTFIFFAGAIPALAVYDANQINAQPVLMRGRLEIQFESDVSPSKMSAALGRLSFGIPTLDQTLEKIGATEATPLFPWRKGKDALVGSDDMSKIYEVIFPEDRDMKAVIDELLQNPYVRSVSPVYAMPLLGVIPNDPGFVNQWALKKINDTLAWATEKGSDTVIIAIIDSGVLYSHLDLKDNIWVNPGEDLDNDKAVYDLDDLNGIDNDGNGYDDLIGWDFFSGFSGDVTCIDDDCGTPDSDPNDYHGHGTHCAGIAAAVSNNALGCAGVAGGWGGGLGPYAGPRIMCLRVGALGNGPSGTTGYVSTINCEQAIDYAADMGADIINCSWGMSQYQSSGMTAALRKAHDAEVLVFHAAGNDNLDYPSYYDTWQDPYGAGHKLVISVAASGTSDYKASYSNFGNWIDITAPGDYIYSTVSNSYVPGYAYYWGTSMAAPHLAGLAALIRSHMPDYTADQVKELIYFNADPMPDVMWSQGYLGYGRINAYGALDSLPAAAFTAGPAIIGKQPLTVNFTDQSPHSPTFWQWDFGDGGNSGSQNPSHTFNNFGLYTVKLTINDEFGTATEVLKNLVMVLADTIKCGTVVTTPNAKVVIPVYLNNKFQAKNIFIPFRIRRQHDGSIPNYVILDSVSGAGLRAGYFEKINIPIWDEAGQMYTVAMQSNITAGHSDYLVPDTGLILKLYFTVGSTGQNEVLRILDTTIDQYSLKIESIIYNYNPVFAAGQIGVTNCSRGDALWDGFINILDAACIINYLYKGSPVVPDRYCGDVDANGTLNILDVGYLIAYLYKGGPLPPP